MKRLISILAGTIVCNLPAAASVVADTQGAETQATSAAIPENEIRIHQGIVHQGTLCQHMAAINDYDSAEAAVPAIMRIHEDLQLWAQSFKSLPPISDLETQLLEDRYLPTIRKINHIIEAQADRLGAAEYYGSKNLAAALVRVAQIGHN